jgi:hypothetical protein
MWCMWSSTQEEGCTEHSFIHVVCRVPQVLWQQLSSVTALVFAAALRRIQEVQALMDLGPRCAA